jgi:hypothetical protein
MPTIKDFKLPMLSLRALLTPSTINEGARTIDVVFGTENPVIMTDYSIGKYNEILSFDPSHVRLDRLNSGAPVLDNHDRNEQIGVVENARIENNQGVATIRFSKNEHATKIWNDVTDGIIRNISVGYNVFSYQEIPSQNSDIPTFKAIDWQPAEISTTSVPADFKSGVRSSNQEQNTIVKISQLNKQLKMETPEEIQARLAAEAKARTDSEAAQARTAAEEAERTRKASESASSNAIATERQRSSDILTAVRSAKLPASFAEKLIANGTSLDQARAEIISEFAKADPNAGSSNVHVGADESDKKREAKIAALVLRATPDAESKKLISADLVSAARQYRGQTLLEIARESLESTGENTRGMDKMELVKRSITSSTSDFPVLLSGVNRQILLNSYSAVADTWRSFCRTGSVSDFREFKRLRMGTLSNLDLVGENQEFKNKKINDADYEKISASTKGNIINVSRQMIVNDDLSGLSQLASMLGRAAARSIESDVYAMFALNSGNGPTMVDGNPLFHASHGNIAGTAAIPSVASFDAIRTQMKSIKDKDNNDFLDIMPAIWLGPTALGGSAKVVNDAQFDTDVSNKFQVPNKSRGLFNQIIDTPRLSGTAWYALADAGVEPVFEVVFLDGQQTPYLESEMGFDVDGMRWKVRHDYGVGAIGYKGIVKNAGV